MQSLPKKLPPERHDRRFVIESPMPMQSTMHVYEVHPRKDHRGIDLISDAAIRSLVVWRAECDQLTLAVLIRKRLW